MAHEERVPRKKGYIRLWQALGILLIGCGLVLLGYFIYQKVEIAYYQYQLRKAYEDTFCDLPDDSDAFDHVVITERQPMRVIIPRIDVDLQVLIGDVFDQVLLDKGPVHFQMSDLPSTESGNVAIAAHRGSRWGFFTDLDQLEPGDEIYLDVEGYPVSYTHLDVYKRQTDVGDSALIIGDTGRVVPPQDPAALAAAWRELIEMGPENRARLGKVARKRIADNFSLPVIAARYEKLYKEIVKQRG